MIATFAGKISRFLLDESGPTAVEYAVLLAMILVMCISAILSTGDIQQSMWFDAANEMADKMNQ